MSIRNLDWLFWQPDVLGRLDRRGRLELGVESHLGHQVTRHQVGRDRLVGSRQLQAADRAGLARAGDDPEPGVEVAGDQRDVDAALVGVDGADERLRMLDAGFLEHLFVGCVALDMEAVLVPKALDRVLVAVDHHVLLAGAGEFPDDLGAHPAVAADDQVVTELTDLPLQPADPPEFEEMPLAERLREDAKAVEHGTDAANDQHRGEDAARRSQRVDLGEAHRRDGDDRHVEGVEQAPTLDQEVAGGAEDDDDREQDGGQPEPREGVFDAGPDHARVRVRPSSRPSSSSLPQRFSRLSWKRVSTSSGWRRRWAAASGDTPALTSSRVGSFSSLSLVAASRRRASLERPSRAPSTSSRTRPPLAEEVSAWLNGGFEVFTASLDGALAGVVRCSFPTGTCLVDRMAVDPERHSAGVGRALAEHAIARARRAGVTKVWVQATPKLEDVVQLYRSLGFRESGHLRAHYWGEDVTLMELPL